MREPDERSKDFVLTFETKVRLRLHLTLTLPLTLTKGLRETRELHP